jgi:hypothetical protein
VATERFSATLQATILRTAAQPRTEIIRGGANLAQLIATLRYSVEKRPVAPAKQQDAFQMIKNRADDGKKYHKYE